MGWFTSDVKTMTDLLHKGLTYLYDGEKRQVKELKTLADTAHATSLKQALRDHLTVTEKQVERCEGIFELLHVKKDASTCDTMKSLIGEMQNVASLSCADDVRDQAIIGAVQRAAHYQISGYGTLRTYARRVGRDDIAELLDQGVVEESQFDDILTAVAMEVPVGAA